MAQQSVAGQLEGIPFSGHLGTDGLWARLRGGAKRVVLILVDSASGLLWPAVVEAGEESRRSWVRLFQRAKVVDMAKPEAGLDVEAIGSVTSDGARGLLGYLRRRLPWVRHQRCVWHLWRNLGRDLARQASKVVDMARPATAELVGEAARRASKQLRGELVALIRGVLPALTGCPGDAQSYDGAEASLAELRRHPRGARIWKLLNEQFDSALVHLLDGHQGLTRVTPEWCWRDFRSKMRLCRQRLSRSRNHGSHRRCGEATQRLERAALVWAIYHNFAPAQRRCERKRHYRRPGQGAFEVAGYRPGGISYLDALCV